VNPLPVYHGGGPPRYLQAWGLSVLLHAAVVGAAITLVSDLHLAPLPEPFRWDVSVVVAPAPERAGTPRSSPTEPAPMAAQPVEPQPVTKPVQPVIQQKASQEVRENAPVVPTPGPVTQTVDRPVQAVETRQQPVPLETPELVPTAEAPPVVREAEPPATPARSAEALPDPPPQPAAVSNPVAEETRTAVREYPARPMTATKADYGWLAEALWSRIEQLKRYPHLARMNRWEGRVVLRVVIQEDGHLLDLAVSESSGHSILDQDALEVLKLASPLMLKHPLGKPQVVVQVPISYRLER